MVGGQHNYNLCVVVPDHSPEVFCGVGQRMLGNDEFITLVVTLKKKKCCLHHINLDLGDNCVKAYIYQHCLNLNFEHRIWKETTELLLAEKLFHTLHKQKGTDPFFFFYRHELRVTLNIIFFTWALQYSTHQGEFYFSCKVLLSLLYTVLSSRRKFRVISAEHWKLKWKAVLQIGSWSRGLHSCKKPKPELFSSFFSLIGVPYYYRECKICLSMCLIPKWFSVNSQSTHSVRECEICCFNFNVCWVNHVLHLYPQVYLNRFWLSLSLI